MKTINRIVFLCLSLCVVGESGMRAFAHDTNNHQRHIHRDALSKRMFQRLIKAGMKGDSGEQKKEKRTINIDINGKVILITAALFALWKLWAMQRVHE